MRKVVRKVSSLAMAGVVSMVLGVASAHAEFSLSNVDCETYAKAVADEANKDQMQRAGAFDTSKPGKVMMIAGGQKFYMPTQNVNPNAMAPASAYDAMYDWNKSYRRAKWDCPARVIVIDRTK